MDISTPCVVTLTWTLSDAQGKPIDELAEPLEFLVGGQDLLPKVEEALIGQTVGFEAQIHLEPENAFGDYDSKLVCFEDRSLFPADVGPGMQFEGLPPGAATPDMPGDAVYTVTEVYPNHVVLDGNHPLAGMALRLALKVRDVREATDDEVKAGSVGGPVFSVVGSAEDSPDARGGRTLH
ncbi:MAG: peptidylprolyl isomerase [Betaproteobacteria bacterium]|nr:peptidylprolyl isomerase [Betaproteobacteria bacterium]NBT09741.1 peptidylprolyl isomerase [Betaproteobacteria bacterium]NBU49223.1 peptidylprolyl isomerase [Betaproteobacteria bacterium]NBX96129.1 peptidylprolyl isomerase [Betaproteobacteria bacterium]